MSPSTRMKWLRVALLIVGCLFVFFIYPLMVWWPAGWTWHTGHSDYVFMIVGIYATLGLFLIAASRQPLAHTSLIWFTVFSSVVHGAIMLWQSFASPTHLGHLMGDVPALFIIAATLAWLMPRGVHARDSKLPG